MKAEREKRAVIAESEGEKQAKINSAQGDRQQMIERSEGEKQKRINEAEGLATEIVKVADATALGIRTIADAINQQGGSDAVNLRIAEQYIQQFGNIAKEGNTLIIPSNLTDIAGVVTAAKSALDNMGGSK